jgi:methylmalonyl-CoA mutase
MAAPIRVLTAVPICDGHDSAINTINLEFIRHGIEVVYLGYHRYVQDIVRAAIQEDVRAIGISSYNGGHVEFFVEVVKQLRKRGVDDIAVFGGGGGTITHDDQRVMQKRGVDKIFFAGTSLTGMVEWVHERYGKGKRGSRDGAPADMQLARKLTQIEDAYSSGKTPRKAAAKKSSGTRVIGFTGPGGAARRPDRRTRAAPAASRRHSRIAILSHDPSVVGEGALLGDRATMINSQHDRVFMRSMATRGQAGGLSPATEDCLQLLAQSGFDYVIIETSAPGRKRCRSRASSSTRRCS